MERKPCRTLSDVQERLSANIHYLAAKQKMTLADVAEEAAVRFRALGIVAGATCELDGWEEEARVAHVLGISWEALLSTPFSETTPE